MNLAHVSPAQNLYVQYRDTPSATTTTTLGMENSPRHMVGNTMENSPRHIVGNTISRQLLYNDVMGQGQHLPPSAYNPLLTSSPRHQSESTSGMSGSQAADDEYYYVSTTKSNNVGNNGDSILPQYLSSRNGTPTTQVKHIPVTVL